MRFRLFYEGPFYSSSGEVRLGQTDRRAEHKHDLRREFHRQLKHYWEENEFLQSIKSDGGIFDDGVSHQLKPLSEALVDRHTRFGFQFVPLVCKQFRLTCELNVLVLRRDRPGGIFQARDIDNRLKTLFDALKMPKDQGEIGSASPRDDETPFYVLLQSDDLITHVSVETDHLLAPPAAAGSDDGFARVLISVNIAPYAPSMFSLGFVSG